MGAVKDYYHDEICEGMELPRGDEVPREPFVRKWWHDEDDDKEWIKSQEKSDGDNGK